MFAGLPGIGIGGIFYMVLAIGMLARVIWRWVRRQAIRAGAWRAAWGQLAMVSAMGVVLAYEAEAVVWAVQKVQSVADLLATWLLPGDHGPAAHAATAAELRPFLPSMPYAAVTILAVVVLVVQVARAIHRQRAKERTALTN